MKAVFKGDVLVLVPEGEDETGSLAAWKDGHDGWVLGMLKNAGAGCTLRFLGHRDDACREPINVTSRHPDPQVQLIGNLATTAFELDGRRYASVEGFWQGLKFPRPADRERVAALSEMEAKKAGATVEYETTLRYEGAEVAVGTWAHWQLMRRACEAKFAQHADARAALLATGDRPLAHKVRKDSRTIPGVILADIWMAIRRRHRTATAPPTESDGEEVG